MRARGLKLVSADFNGKIIDVAPHAGAWIETDEEVVNLLNQWSRPMRARGLKLYYISTIEKLYKSRPMRARGLKHKTIFSFRFKNMSRPMRARGLKHVICPFMRHHLLVAPHAGAWIETLMM